MSLFLSICIPTYNRAQLLHSALKSIESNLDLKKSVEVIISDNGSNDNTEEIVTMFKDQIINLQYHRNSQNIGPVKNVRNVIEMAKGDYVWLFSDDDIMANEALTNLLSFLSGHNDVGYAFFTRNVVDVNLNPTKIGIQPKNLNENVVFSNGNDLFCGCDGQMPYLLGFYSSTIIKRQIWLDKASEVSAIANDYAWDHLNIILKAIKNTKCAVLSKVGVHARLNYRQIKANSKVSFDDSIQCFLNAIELGYSQKICLNTIKHIVSNDSKVFIVDKAIGVRKDGLLRFLIRQKLKRMIAFSFPWLLLDFLPHSVLNVLWRIYCRVKKRE